LVAAIGSSSAVPVGGEPGRGGDELAAIGQLNERAVAYLKDVLTRLPTQLNSRIEELLPHRWQACRLRSTCLTPGAAPTRLPLDRE